MSNRGFDDPIDGGERWPPPPSFPPPPQRPRVELPPPPATTDNFLLPSVPPRPSAPQVSRHVVGEAFGWPSGEGSSSPSAVEQFLEACAALHDRQRFWSQAVRLGWWLLLLPVALWCWAATMQPGGARRLALAGIAVVSALAVFRQDASTDSQIEVAAGGTEVSVDAFAEVEAPESDLAEQMATSSTTQPTTTERVTTSSESTTTSVTSSTAAPSTTEATSTTTASTVVTTTTVPTTTTTVATTTTVLTTTTAAPTTEAVTSTTQAAAACDPNYSGACVPIASDVDCAGGSGNGPAYVQGPVQVVGQDIYGLDSNNDGVGCE